MPLRSQMPKSPMSSNSNTKGTLATTAKYKSLKKTYHPSAIYATPAKMTIASTYYLVAKTCFLPRCQCPAKLRPNISCVLGLPPLPLAKPPFSPHSTLNIQIIEFTYYNDMFPTTAIACKLNKVCCTPTTNIPTRLERTTTHNPHYKYKRNHTQSQCPRPQRPQYYSP